MTASTTDPRVQTASSVWRLTATARHRGAHRTVWYLPDVGASEIERARRILASDMGMGGRRVRVETIA